MRWHKPVQETSQNILQLWDLELVHFEKQFFSDATFHLYYQYVYVV